MLNFHTVTKHFVQSPHSTHAREPNVWHQRMAKGSNGQLWGDGIASMTSVSSSHSNNQPQPYSYGSGQSMVSGSKCVWGWFGFVCFGLGLVWSDRSCFVLFSFFLGGGGGCLFACLFVVVVFYLFVLFCFILFCFVLFCFCFCFLFVCLFVVVVFVLFFWGGGVLDCMLLIYRFWFCLVWSFLFFWGGGGFWFGLVWYGFGLVGLI